MLAPAGKQPTASLAGGGNDTAKTHLAMNACRESVVVVGNRIRVYRIKELLLIAMGLSIGAG